MNEQTNRERVLQLLDAYSASDFDKVLSFCSEDLEHLASAPIDILPHLGPRRGKDEVRRMWETVRSRYVERRHEVLALIAEGDQVAADLRVYLRKRSNDRIVRYDVAVFYTLRDGRITRIREIMDTFDLVQQVLERDLSRAGNGASAARAVSGFEAPADSSAAFSSERPVQRPTRFADLPVLATRRLNLAPPRCDLSQSIERAHQRHENHLASLRGADHRHVRGCRARRRARVGLDRDRQHQRFRGL
jgi:hypothetical protein